VPACHFDPSRQYDQAQPFVYDPSYSNEVTYRTCDHITPGKHSSELFAEATVDFLERYDGDAPFFAYVSFMAPHDPRTMPQEYLDMYDADEVDEAPNWMPKHPFDNGEMVVRDEKLAPWPRTPEEMRRHTAEYYAMITHLDAQIGRVLAALEASGGAENTIIVLAGDNGLAIGRHGLMGKQNMYDHSLHVPLIISGPGIPKNQRSDALCYLLDIYPTLCDLIELPIPDTVEGQSLVPAIQEGTAPRESLFFAYRGVQRAVQDSRFKLIEYVVEGQRHTQLYDLQADPYEMNDLSANERHTGQVERLRGELLRWRDELDDDQPEQGEPFWGAYSV
jgi:arylsulfatase A-like enzyme